MDEKRRLRSEMAASLRDISAEDFVSAGRQACRALVAWEGFERARELVLFSSLPDEIDTRPFLDTAHSTGKAVLLPRIVAGDLEFALANRGEPWIRGRYGIFEPGPGAVARRVDRDAIVLVPGIAFDVGGGRLGRGAGYYDRALERMRGDGGPTAIIGLGLALQIVDRVPMTPMDVHVHGILTEDGLTWVGADRSSDADRG